MVEAVIAQLRRLQRALPEMFVEIFFEEGVELRVGVLGESAVETATQAEENSGDDYRGCFLHKVHQFAVAACAYPVTTGGAMQSNCALVCGRGGRAVGVQALACSRFNCVWLANQLGQAVTS